MIEAVVEVYQETCIEHRLHQTPTETETTMRPSNPHLHQRGAGRAT